MSDPSPAARWSSPEMRARLRRRHASERRFRRLGLGAIGLALLALATLLASIVGNGSTAFVRTRVALDVHFDPEVLGALADLPPAEREVRAGDVDWGASATRNLNMNIRPCGLNQENGNETGHWTAG